jgi:NAD(P)-dependent dehydrogenase (short-subunit alcohol dehydrogenase family)
MVEAGSGVVVTAGSEASLRGGVSGSSYSAFKQGILGLVKHVAHFSGPEGVRSNAVLPGGVETGIGASAMPQSQWAIERAGMALAWMSPIAAPVRSLFVTRWTRGRRHARV